MSSEPMQMKSTITYSELIPYFYVALLRRSKATYSYGTRQSSQPQPEPDVVRNTAEIRLRDGNSVTVGTYKFCKVHLSNDKFTCLYSFLLLFPRTISFFSLFHNFIPICHQTATFVLVSSPVRL